SKPGDMAAVGSVLVTFRVEGARSREMAGEVGRPPKTPALADGPAAPAALFRADARETGRADAATGTSLPSANSVIAERPIASPAVRRRAREAGVSLKGVPGSGPNGRILQADLEAATSSLASASAGSSRKSSAEETSTRVAKQVPDAITEIRLVGLRRKIAERMAQSKRTIPHFSYVEELDVTELEALRLHLNGSASEGQPKLSPLAFIMRAVVRALPKFPHINATFDGEAGILRQSAAVHIGVATQTPGGLMVPVVRHVERLNLWECAREVTRVASLARSGKAAREELSGSTLTLTSLGSLGGIAATPVINYPEVAIIGPNRIVERPCVRDGVIVVRKMMNLSSSFDHRVVDGYDAAAFIQTIRAMLEHPASIFIESA
ncbi:MAG: dihydrolipoamide acetyltransferase family protein, partial [Gammaproteobacteria bacterium]